MTMSQTHSMERSNIISNKSVIQTDNSTGKHILKTHTHTPWRGQQRPHLINNPWEGQQ